MRIEVLFLRWLLVIALVAGGIIYFAYPLKSRTPTRYEAIPLANRGRLSETPLAGIIVDPARRDISAIVGRPATTAMGEHDFFFILREGERGESYATAFRTGEARPSALFEISPRREIRVVHAFEDTPPSQALQLAANTSDAERSLRSLFDALPPTDAEAER